MTAYTDFHYSPTGSGVISGSQVLEQTEQGINGLGQYVQDNISGAIDTANQALTIAQTANTNATTALNTANSFSDAITTANQTANNALTTAQSAQSTANAASSLATTANNNATSALNAANAATSNVNTLTSTVNGLGNRMTTAENAISTNAGNITTLQTNLQTTNNNVTAAANAASAAQATATSAQSTATLARNQAYVLRYTGTTITGGGTIAYADIDNTDNIKAGDKIIDNSGAIYAIASVDTANETVTVGASPVINLFCDAENLIPAANDTYDLGSSSYQWNNLYAKNYYYNGTAWGLDKANVWTAEQTITNNFFVVKETGYELGQSYPNGSHVSGLKLRDKNGSTVGLIDIVDRSYGNMEMRIRIQQKYDPNSNNRSTSGDILFNELIVGITPDKQNYIGFNADLWGSNHNLGTSTNKWTTLNGINPGALSLPGAYENINNQIKNPSDQLNAIDLNGGSNTWVSDVDCYLYFYIPNNKFTWIRIFWPPTLVRCGQTFVPVPNETSDYSGFVPVPANTTVIIQVKGSQTPTFRRSACIGNA